MEIHVLSDFPSFSYNVLQNKIGNFSQCFYPITEKHEILREFKHHFSQTFTSVSIKQLDYELEISIAW